MLTKINLFNTWGSFGDQSVYTTRLSRIYRFEHYSLRRICFPINDSKCIFTKK